MLSLKNVGIAYGEERILSELCLDFPRGSISLVTGQSGSGKSSLIKYINGIIPTFEPAVLQGDIFLDGRSIGKEGVDARAAYISTVFQNPKTQFYATRTTDEMAFAMENQALEPEEIWARIDRYSRMLQLEHLLDRDIFKLSGGEKQLVAVGSVACLDGEVYIFDEPSSSLDREAILRLRHAMECLRDMGKIVIIAEHRLYYIADLAEQIIVLEEGRACRIEGTGGDMHMLKERLQPYSLRSLRETEREANVRRKKKDLFAKESDLTERLQCRDFCFGYRRNRILFDFDIGFDKGIYFLAGANGIGKSTFLRCLCGLQVCKGAKIYCDGKLLRRPAEAVFLVMQDVHYQLFTESVWEEISLVSEDACAKEAVLRDLDLWEKKDLHPAALSGGQKQRLLLGMSLLSVKPVIVMDEPTSGLCRKSMEKTMEILRRLEEAGKTVLIVSHDDEFIRACGKELIEFVQNE